MFRGECWCPLLKEVRFQPCVNQPAADFLLEAITQLIEQKGQYTTEEQER